MEITGKPAVRPADFNLAEYWETSTAAFKSALPRYPASLLVMDSTMKELERERYVRILHQEPAAAPGWITAEAEFHTLESACKIILSLSPGIQVTAPEDLTTAVTSALRGALALYEFL